MIVAGSLVSRVSRLHYLCCDEVRKAAVIFSVAWPETRLPRLYPLNLGEGLLA